MEAEVYPHQYKVEKEHWWFTARMAILLRFLERKLGTVRTVRILDVGCGTGAVLEAFSGRYQSAGLDTSAAAIDYCRERGLHNLHLGDIASYPKSSQFDVVSFLDVLEHIEDDLGALRQAHGLLAPEGHLLVTVPAYPFLWSPLDEALHHKRRYTQRALRSVVAEAGFSVEHLTHFNTVLFPVALLRRLLARSSSGDALRDLQVPGPFLNRMLRMTFALERFAVPVLRIPVGLSLLCWARKT